MTNPGALPSLEDRAARGSDESRDAWVDDGTMPDALLVRRTLAGDPRAFAALVDRHSGVCLRYATRMLGTREDAEDAAQEAWLRAYRALHTYEPSRPFRTWLLTILVNRCRTAKLLQRRREARVVVDDELLTLAAVAPDASIEEDDEIARALAQLDPLQREAFLLKHVEQLSYDEMAAVTGAGVSALKMRVSRACEHLRRALADRGGSDHG